MTIYKCTYINKLFVKYQTPPVCLGYEMSAPPDLSSDPDGFIWPDLPSGFKFGHGWAPAGNHSLGRERNQSMYSLSSKTKD